MPRSLFCMTIQAGEHERLRRLNEEYADALRRVTASIEGLHGIEKYVFGDQYVECIDLDGDFAEFSRQLSADSDVRQFLREVGRCFVGGLREMPNREMACIQSLPEPIGERTS